MIFQAVKRYKTLPLLRLGNSFSRRSLRGSVRRRRRRTLLHAEQVRQALRPPLLEEGIQKTLLQLVLAVHHVVPRANVNRAVGLLALAHDEDVVPLLELRLANLLLHLAIGIVDLAVEALLAKHAANLVRVVPALL